jgi:hypothetical protein
MDHHGKIMHAIEQLCARNRSPTTEAAIVAFTGLGAVEVREAVVHLARCGLLCERAIAAGGLVCPRGQEEVTAGSRRAEARNGGPSGPALREGGVGVGCGSG